MDFPFSQQRLDVLRARIANIQGFQKQYEKELRLVIDNPIAAAKWKERIKGLKSQLQDPITEYELLTQQAAAIPEASLRIKAQEQLAQMEQDLQGLQGEQDALLGEEPAIAPEVAPISPPPQQPGEPDVQLKLDALRQRIQSLGAPIGADHIDIDPSDSQAAELNSIAPPPDYGAEAIAAVEPPETPSPPADRPHPEKIIDADIAPLLTAPDPPPLVELSAEQLIEQLSEFHSQLEAPRRPFWKSRKLMLVPVLLIALLPLSWAFPGWVKTVLQQTADEQACNQELQKTGNQKRDFLANKSILDACIALKSREPNNVSAWKNAGRASLLTWSSEYDDATKKELINQTRGYFLQAVDKSEKKDPQALFYWKFMDDFEEFTSKSKEKSKRSFQCDMPASERYKEALAIYNPPASAGEKPHKISQGDEFILLELSHFLINRDVVSQDAVDLLDSILKANPDPEHKSKILKNIWLSKAGAEARLKKYDQVRDSLVKALEYDPKSYKITQDLGSAYGQIAIDPSSPSKDRDRELAIAAYQKVTQNSDTANSYRAWRNLSFLLYLQEKYAEAAQTFDKTLTFKVALSEDDQENEGLIREYRDLAMACSTSGNCPQNKKEALEKELRDRQIFSNYFITHDLIETEVKDPFFDVEHDLFYKCQK